MVSPTSNRWMRRGRGTRFGRGGGTKSLVVSSGLDIVPSLHSIARRIRLPYRVLALSPSYHILCLLTTQLLGTNWRYAKTLRKAEGTTPVPWSSTVWAQELWRCSTMADPGSTPVPPLRGSVNASAWRTPLGADRGPRTRGLRRPGGGSLVANSGQ
jgi:hypothetical protein